MKKNGTKRRFVVCVKNDGYPVSLEPQKIYTAVSDAEASKHQLVRVVDESGEDYLYPAITFCRSPLPSRCKKLSLWLHELF